MYNGALRYQMTECNVYGHSSEAGTQHRQNRKRSDKHLISSGAHALCTLSGSASSSGRLAQLSGLAQVLGGGFNTLVANFGCAERVAVLGCHQKHIFLPGARTARHVRGAA